jgi:uncharacterized membrane protein YdjX (TVP38/TMEM64 family)
MRIGKKHHGTWAGILVAIAALLGVYWFSPLKLLFDEAFLTTELKQLGAYGPLFFVALFTLSLSLGFPGNLMAVVGGTVFGLFWGTLWSLLGSTLGAVGAFCLARYWLHDWFQRGFGRHPRLQRLQRTIATYPLMVVLSVRLTPLSPFSLVNFLFGLTPVNLKTYTVGTFFGLIPLTFTYCWLGSTGQRALQGGDRFPFFLALVALGGLTVLPIVVKKPQRLRSPSPPALSPIRGAQGGSSPSPWQNPK